MKGLVIAWGDESFLLSDKGAAIRIKNAAREILSDSGERQFPYNYSSPIVRHFQYCLTAFSCEGRWEVHETSAECLGFQPAALKFQDERPGMLSERFLERRNSSARERVVLQGSGRQGIEEYQCDEVSDKEHVMTPLKVILLEDLIGDHKGGQETYARCKRCIHRAPGKRPCLG